MSTAEPLADWLVLLFQFPRGSGSQRVKVWRRLQNIGAVAVKNSVYVLPESDQSREDFQWLLAELREAGAEAALLQARFIDGLARGDVVDLFNAARDSDYAQLVEDIDGAAAGQDSETAADEAEATRRQVLQRMRKRLGEIEAIDFFGAGRSGEARAALRALEARLAEGGQDSKDGEQSVYATALSKLKQKVWVTRRHVGVDRIACAWLIRGWIDPEARFRFVDPKGHAQRPNEIRFDMFEAEFTHDGDACTFEVLLRLLPTEDAALRSVAEVVHDIDLKDGRYARPETQGVAGLIDGLVRGEADDERRLERGGALFQHLYQHFSDVDS